MDGELEMERLGLVPSGVRDYVLDRDNHCCRVCGRYVEYPALHHLRYRSQGGLDIPSNLVTIGWLFDHDCHLLVHSNKGLWQPILLRIAEDPSITALAARRWLRQPPGAEPASDPPWSGSDPDR